MPQPIDKNQYQAQYQPDGTVPGLKIAQEILPNFDEYKTGQPPETYNRVLHDYLRRYRDKPISTTRLTEPEMQQLRDGITAEIIDRYNMSTEDFNFLLEQAKWRKEQELNNEGGLPQLGVIVSRLNNSPVGKEFKTWLEASKTVANQTIRAIEKWFAIKK